MRREMQIVFQDPYASLDPRMTVGDIVAEPLAGARDRHAAEPRARPCAGCSTSSASTRTSRNRYPHEFSGGQRQRIGIARALALNPKLIVCDEPVSALDVSIQAQILNLLKDLQRDFGLTYLFIAHDLAVVRTMSDRIAVMNQGQARRVGPAEQVYTSAEGRVHEGAARGRARPGPAPAAGAQGRAPAARACDCRGLLARSPARRASGASLLVVRRRVEAAAARAAARRGGASAPAMSQRRSYTASRARRPVGLRRGRDGRRHRPPAPRSSSASTRRARTWTTLSPLPVAVRARRRRPRSGGRSTSSAARRRRAAGAQVVRVLGRPGHVAPARAAAGAALQRRRRRPRREDLVPRRPRARRAEARRLRLRPARGTAGARGAAAAAGARRARRGRLPGADLDDRRHRPERRAAALGVGARPGRAALARRPAACRPGSSSRARPSPTGGPCGLGAHLRRSTTRAPAAGRAGRRRRCRGTRSRCSRSPGGCGRSAAAPSTCTTARSSRSARSRSDTTVRVTLGAWRPRPSPPRGLARHDPTFGASRSRSGSRSRGCCAAAGRRCWPASVSRPRRLRSRPSAPGA